MDDTRRLGAYPHGLVGFSHRLDRLAGFWTSPERGKYKGDEKGKAPEHLPNKRRRIPDLIVMTGIVACTAIIANMAIVLIVCVLGGLPVTLTILPFLLLLLSYVFDILAVVVGVCV